MEKTLAPPVRKKTILVVDGDELMRQLLTDIFTHHDLYNLLTAENGSDGLQRSREFPGEIDVLLTDLQLSGMSGMELAEAIAAERSAIKVLLISEIPRGWLLLNEGWHFLTKPFIASQLRTIVAGLVSPTRESRFAASRANQ